MVRKELRINLSEASRKIISFDIDYQLDDNYSHRLKKSKISENDYFELQKIARLRLVCRSFCTWRIGRLVFNAI